LLVLGCLRIVVSIDLPLNAHSKIVHHGDRDEVGRQQHVDKQEQEVFPVPEAYAVVDPRAVMVHVQDTSIAGGAVMAPLWLEHVAH
jgi:hypothetical protein